jgi:hypothetical protein
VPGRRGRPVPFPTMLLEYSLLAASLPFVCAARQRPVIHTLCLVEELQPPLLLRSLPTGWAATNRATSPQATAILPFDLNDGFNTSPVHPPKTR